MHVKTKYKQTEIGLIPEDWALSKLGEIGSVSSGGTPHRAIESYWNGSIPWITTTQIDFNTIEEAEEFITEEGLKHSAAKLFPAGTLLLAMYGQGKTRGKVALLGIEATTNQACAAIQLRNSVSIDFVFHHLLNQYESIRRMSNSGSQENLNGLIIKSIPIPIPPLPEQRAIATALSDVDALINSLDRLIAKKQDIKQATLQQLLTGKTRLPGFSGPWLTRQLKDVTAFVGAGKTTLRVASGGYPLYGSTGIIGYTDAAEYEGEAILVARVGANAGALNSVTGTYGVTDNTVIVRVANCCDLTFLLYFLETKQLNKLTFGSGQPLITGSQLKSLIVDLPSIDEQRAIAQFLSDMGAEISSLKQRRDKTLLLKQGMMQELLTGRSRLV